MGVANYVKACTKIDKCSTSSKSVNVCDVCETGYGHKMAADGTIDFTTCEKMDNNVDVPSNCLSFVGSKCVICDKYYSVDKDGKCAKYTIPICN